MQIQEILEKYKTRALSKEPVLSERSELLKKFVDRLNSDRVSSGRKPLKAGVYAIKMYQSGLKSNGDLYWFYGYCNDAKNFSSCWWWSLKAQKTNGTMPKM